MNILIRKVDQYRGVIISCNGTTIDLGKLVLDVKAQISYQTNISLVK